MPSTVSHSEGCVQTHTSQIANSLLSLPSLAGLGVYSSESDSDSGDSHRDNSKPRGSRDGKSSSSSSKSSKRKKSSKDVVTSKLPKPEEIAAAFKDTKAAVSSKEKPAFMPVPRAVQEKQRDSGKTSSKQSERQLCCHPYFMFIAIHTAYQLVHRYNTCASAIPTTFYVHVKAFTYICMFF